MVHNCNMWCIVQFSVVLMVGKEADADLSKGCKGLSVRPVRAEFVLHSMT